MKVINCKKCGKEIEMGFYGLYWCSECGYNFYYGDFKNHGEAIPDEKIVKKKIIHTDPEIKLSVAGDDQVAIDGRSLWERAFGIGEGKEEEPREQDHFIMRLGDMGHKNASGKTEEPLEDQTHGFFFPDMTSTITTEYNYKTQTRRIGTPENSIIKFPCPSCDRLIGIDLTYGNEVGCPYCREGARLNIEVIK